MITSGGRIECNPALRSGITMENRTEGMARSEKFMTTLWNDQTGPTAAWTLQDHQRDITGGVSTGPTPSVADTPCLSCLIANPLYRDGVTQFQLLEATTRSCRRRRAIRSRGHQKPLTSWEAEATTISLKVERVPRKR